MAPSPAALPAGSVLGSGCWGQGVRVSWCRGVRASILPRRPIPACADRACVRAALRDGRCSASGSTRVNPWRAAPGVQVTAKPLPLSPPGLGSGPCLGLGLGGFAGLGIWGTCCPLGAARALTAALAVCAESGHARHCRGHCRPQRGADPRLRLRVPMRAMLAWLALPSWCPGWWCHASTSPRCCPAGAAVLAPRAMAL